MPSLRGSCTGHIALDAGRDGVEEGVHFQDRGRMEEVGGTGQRDGVDEGIE